MPDYTYATGAGGIMLIRDQGLNVEFHIQAGQSATYVGGLRWQRFVNGGWSGLLGPVTYNSGRPWVHIDTFPVGGNQTIIFRLEATGTQGLGGPTEFPQWIQRATPPTAPVIREIDQIGHTTMRVRFEGISDGGSPIREWQIGYGTNTGSPQFTVSSNGLTLLSKLALGTTYYIWARGRNDVGWGPWSARTSGRTLAGSRVKRAGVWREAIAMVRVAGVWRQAIPFGRRGGKWYDGV